ncbi:shikimate kinase [Cellulomonas denverensis]|uniref:shikimate kinase n=1 Tax=Cellulomonas denverensis TaxID=264297 RepID=UPI0035E7EDCC
MSATPSPAPPGRRGTPPPAPDRGPLVVLIGPMGSGKTAIGRALSRRWDVPLRDTDVDIEEHAGTTIADIFLHQGEQAFRDLEHQIVAAALDEHRGVLALGGVGRRCAATPVSTWRSTRPAAARWSSWT